MKRRLIRLALIGAALALAGFIVAASGVIPIKASSGHWPVTEWFLRFSMKRSIATHSLGVDVPANLADPNLVQKGATHYELACRACHGEPHGPRPRVAAHMLPMPPDLAPRVRASDPKKLFHVVKHGLKFTGMPAWPAQQRDDEVWAMVAFLLKYPELTAADYQRLAGRDLATPPAAGEATLGAPPRPFAAQTCARCHGDDGLGRENVTMPHLAGQRAAYLRKALEAYASGRRHSGTMGPIAAELPANAIEELADYYAGTRPPPRDAGRGNGTASLSADHAAIARGEVIARKGIPAERVPACIECHAPEARRGKPEYPLLAGQPAGYLELQLTLFRENRRGGSDHAHLMQPIASRLTPEQARDVAHYFASLSTAAPNQPAPK